MDSLKDVTDLIKRAIVEEPPIAQKDGGIIKEGYNEDVDKFRQFPRQMERNGWLNWKQRNGNSTGIKNHEDQIQSSVWLFSGSYQYL